ncbi:hypothetical protein ED733_006030 [Metarhizium rileyi]|uniref:Uncharacterized protein n=1 Tax=Metarhizium rileyi (strain RCEF 4871) TaxID=1649241 RepID=A0A5C6GHR4_METRR|nr:hypothetical protein ED733_006030 [Metarhizium rileyi]
MKSSPNVSVEVLFFAEGPVTYADDGSEGKVTHTLAKRARTVDETFTILKRTDHITGALKCRMSIKRSSIFLGQGLEYDIHKQLPGIAGSCSRCG